MNNMHLAVGGLPLPGRTWLSLGERHPSAAGVIALDVDLVAGIITHCEVQPGYLHRAAEKLFEVRDYRSLIMLADRHDWLSSFSGELVVALAVENAMGLEAPSRAVWLRTLLAECGRLHSHLCHLSHLCSQPTAERLWGVVESLRSALLEWSGNRVHPMLNRVGGLAGDIPPQWGLAATLSGDIESLLDRMQTDLDSSGGRFRGLGRTSVDLCMSHGLSGPVARSAGLAMDVRGSGHLAYGHVLIRTRGQSDGDAHARFQTLLEEVSASARMVQRCLDGLPSGPVSVRLSRRLKVPEGVHLAEVEAPWGLASALLVSRGGQTPWRLALRTPTFANISALGEALVGARESQIADAVASMGYSIGDLDK